MDIMSIMLVILITVLILALIIAKGSANIKKAGVKDYETTYETISINSLQMGFYDGTFWNSTPDSSGGVSLRIKFTNRSSTPIKYVTFYIVPYNNVNDIVSCSISRKTETKISATGPYNYDKPCTLTWDNVWYNHSITSVKITKIDIEYMDGSKKEIVI